MHVSAHENKQLLEQYSVSGTNFFISLLKILDTYLSQASLVLLLIADIIKRMKCLSMGGGNKTSKKVQYIKNID